MIRASGNANVVGESGTGGQMKSCVVDKADAGVNSDAFWWPCANTNVGSRGSRDKLVRASFPDPLRAQ